MNMNQNGEYTKHYYADATRIASKIGSGFSQNLYDGIDEILNGIEPSYLDERKDKQHDEMMEELTELINGNQITDIHPRPFPHPHFYHTGGGGHEADLFFYHPDHLGSTGMVTDINATITQGFLYAPFGEIISDYSPAFHDSPMPNYSFNAKELDEESGMYYYSARYYATPTFISRDMLFEKYFWMSPYAYCANNPLKYVDPTGMYPQQLLKKNTDNTYSFKPAATHLLSLVSGVSKTMIETVQIQERMPGQYRPLYSATTGGGAITLGKSSYVANITFTENYFEDNPSMFEGHGYGQNIMEWLNLSSHEVGHIPQINQKGGLVGYLASFIGEYAKYGHDAAPSEIEADKGYTTFRSFNSFVNKNFEENGMENLFNSTRAESKKIEIINKWWDAYQSSLDNE